jgi:TP901 family phage tail tape measure protein
MKTFSLNFSITNAKASIEDLKSLLRSLGLSVKDIETIVGGLESKIAKMIPKTLQADAAGFKSVIDNLNASLSALGMKDKEIAKLTAPIMTAIGQFKELGIAVKTSLGTATAEVSALQVSLTKLGTSMSVLNTAGMLGASATGKSGINAPLGYRTQQEKEGFQSAASTLYYYPGAAGLPQGFDKGSVQAYDQYLTNISKKSKDAASIMGQTKQALAGLGSGESFFVNTTQGFEKMKAPVQSATKALEQHKEETKKVTAETKQLTEHTEKSGKGFAGLIPHVLEVTASYMAMRATLRAIISSFTESVAFEQKMAWVGAATRSTTQELLLLKNAAKEMGDTTAFKATEAADALKYLGFAGFTAMQSIEMLPKVLNLALVGEMDVAKATEIATNVLLSMDMSVGELERACNVLTDVSIRTVTQVEELGQAFKFAGPLGGQLGYTLEEVTAMLGQLSQAGLKGGIAGRGLQAAFLNTSKAAKALGMSLDSDLISVLKKLDEQHIGPVAIAKLFGREATKDVLVLKNNIAQYENLLRSAQNAAGATDTFVARLQETQMTFKRLGAVIANIAIGAFEQYSESLKETLRNTIEFFQRNEEGIILLVTSIGSLIKIGVDLAASFALWKGLSFLWGTALMQNASQLAVLEAAMVSTTASTSIFTAAGFRLGQALSGVVALFKTWWPLLAAYAAMKFATYVYEQVTAFNELQQAQKEVADRWETLKNLDPINLAAKLSTGNGFEELLKDLDDALAKLIKMKAAMETPGSGAQFARQFKINMKAWGDLLGIEVYVPPTSEELSKQIQEKYAQKQSVFTARAYEKAGAVLPYIATESGAGDREKQLAAQQRIELSYAAANTKTLQDTIRNNRLSREEFDKLPDYKKVGGLVTEQTLANMKSWYDQLDSIKNPTKEQAATLNTLGTAIMNVNAAFSMANNPALKFKEVVQTKKTVDTGTLPDLKLTARVASEAEKYQNEIDEILIHGEDQEQKADKLFAEWRKIAIQAPKVGFESMRSGVIEQIKEAIIDNGGMIKAINDEWATLSKDMNKLIPQYYDIQTLEENRRFDKQIQEIQTHELRINELIDKAKTSRPDQVGLLSKQLQQAHAQEQEANIQHQLKLLEIQQSGENAMLVEKQKALSELSSIAQELPKGSREYWDAQLESTKANYALQKKQILDRIALRQKEIDMRKGGEEVKGEKTVPEKMTDLFLTGSKDLSTKFVDGATKISDIFVTGAKDISNILAGKTPKGGGGGGATGGGGSISPTGTPSSTTGTGYGLTNIAKGTMVTGALAPTQDFSELQDIIKKYMYKPLTDLDDTMKESILLNLSTKSPEKTTKDEDTRELTSAIETAFMGAFLPFGMSLKKYTTDTKEAGFITPQGKMIDLSGGVEGKRTFTHYDYAIRHGFESLEKFIEKGFIRMQSGAGEGPSFINKPSANRGYLEIGSSPTKPQYDIMKKVIDESGGGVDVDLIKGKYRWYLEADPWKKTNDILTDIKDFYRKLEYNPEASTIAESKIRDREFEALAKSLENVIKELTVFNSKDENIGMQIKKVFKTTTDIKEAGFVAPSGKMIDLSGGKEGMRDIMHSMYAHQAGYESLQKFLEEGFIRMESGKGAGFMGRGREGYMDIAKEPTSAQYKTIKEVIDSLGGEIRFNLQGGLNKSESEGWIPADPERKTKYIIKEIENYFRSASEEKGIENLAKEFAVFNTKEEKIGMQIEKLYHGSMALFKDNKFEDKYIGSGEGSQVFGYGHYLTQGKEIAADYTMNGGMTYKGQVVDWMEFGNILAKEFEKANLELKTPIEKIDLLLDNLASTISSRLLETGKVEGINPYRGSSEYDLSPYTRDLLNKYPEDLEKMFDYVKDTFGKDLGKEKGYIVEATLSKGAEHDLLKWAEAVSPEQLGKVITQAQKEGWVNPLKELTNFFPNLQKVASQQMTGEALYNRITTFFVTSIQGEIEAAAKETAKWTGGDWYRYAPEIEKAIPSAEQQASKFLNRAGITGMEYPSGTLSGIKDSQYKNIVAYNPADITINRIVDNLGNVVKDFEKVLETTKIQGPKPLLETDQIISIGKILGDIQQKGIDAVVKTFGGYGEKLGLLTKGASETEFSSQKVVVGEYSLHRTDKLVSTLKSIFDKGLEARPGPGRQPPLLFSWNTLNDARLTKESNSAGWQELKPFAAQMKDTVTLLIKNNESMSFGRGGIAGSATMTQTVQPIDVFVLDPKSYGGKALPPKIQSAIPSGHLIGLEELSIAKIEAPLKSGASKLLEYVEGFKNSVSSIAEAGEASKGMGKVGIPLVIGGVTLAALASLLPGKAQAETIPKGTGYGLSNVAGGTMGTTQVTGDLKDIIQQYMYKPLTDLDDTMKESILLEARSETYGTIRTEPEREKQGIELQWDIMKKEFSEGIQKMFTGYLGTKGLSLNEIMERNKTIAPQIPLEGLVQVITSPITALIEGDVKPKFEYIASHLGASESMAKRDASILGFIATLGLLGPDSTAPAKYEAQIEKLAPTFEKVGSAFEKYAMEASRPGDLWKGSNTQVKLGVSNLLEYIKGLSGLIPLGIATANLDATKQKQKGTISRPKGVTGSREAATEPSPVKTIGMSQGTIPEVIKQFKETAKATEIDLFSFSAAAREYEEVLSESQEKFKGTVKEARKNMDGKGTGTGQTVKTTVPSTRPSVGQLSPYGYGVSPVSIIEDLETINKLKKAGNALDSVAVDNLEELQEIDKKKVEFSEAAAARAEARIEREKASYVTSNPIEALALAWEGFEEASKDTTPGRKMYETWTNVFGMMQQSFSDLFYNVLMGKMHSLSDIIKSFFVNLKQSIMRMIADIAAQKVVVNIGASIAGSMVGKGLSQIGGGLMKSLGLDNILGDVFGAGGAAPTGAGNYAGMASPVLSLGPEWGVPSGAAAVTAEAGTATTGAMTGIAGIGAGMVTLGKGISGLATQFGSGALTGLTNPSAMYGMGSVGGAPPMAEMMGQYAPYAAASYLGARTIGHYLMPKYDQKSIQIGGTVGGTIGTFILPGIGTAIGTALGSVIGGLIGGRTKKEYSYTAGTFYGADTYSKTSQESSIKQNKLMIEELKKNGQAWTEGSRQAVQVLTKSSDVFKNYTKTLNTLPTSMGQKQLGVLTEQIHKQIGDMPVTATSFAKAGKQIDTALSKSLTEGLDAWKQQMEQYYQELMTYTQNLMGSALSAAFGSPSVNSATDNFVSTFKKSFYDSIVTTITDAFLKSNTVLNITNGIKTIVDTAVKDASMGFDIREYRTSFTEVPSSPVKEIGGLSNLQAGIQGIDFTTTKIQTTGNKDNRETSTVFDVEGQNAAVQKQIDLWVETQNQAVIKGFNEQGIATGDIKFDFKKYDKFLKGVFDPKALADAAKEGPEEFKKVWDGYVEKVNTGFEDAVTGATIPTYKKGGLNLSNLQAGIQGIDLSQFYSTKSITTGSGDRERTTSPKAFDKTGQQTAVQEQINLWVESQNEAIRTSFKEQGKDASTFNFDEYDAYFKGIFDPKVLSEAMTKGPEEFKKVWDGYVEKANVGFEDAVASADTSDFSLDLFNKYLDPAKLKDMAVTAANELKPYVANMKIYQEEFDKASGVFDEKWKDQAAGIISSALSAGIASGKVADSMTSLRKQMYDSISGAMIDAFANSALIQQYIQPFLATMNTEIANATVGGNFNTTTFLAAMKLPLAILNAGISSLEGPMAAFITVMGGVKKSLGVVDDALEALVPVVARIPATWEFFAKSTTPVVAPPPPPPPVTVPHTHPHRRFAQGDVFWKDMITPFAYGDIFNKPTYFPMKKGLGLLGEAGPEAIMPLSKDKSGKLGVKTQDNTILPLARGKDGKLGVDLNLFKEMSKFSDSKLTKEIIKFGKDTKLSKESKLSAIAKLTKDSTFIKESTKLTRDSKGNIFQRGKLTSFAFGDVIDKSIPIAFSSGGIFDKPTSFPIMPNRIGRMAETGPEVILPLARDSSGKLGVKTQGNDNGRNITLHIHYHGTVIEEKKAGVAIARLAYAEIKKLEDRGH